MASNITKNNTKITLNNGILVLTHQAIEAVVDDSRKGLL